jgi:hypothetical protein
MTFIRDKFLLSVLRGKVCDEALTVPMDHFDTFYLHVLLLKLSNFDSLLWKLLSCEIIVIIQLLKPFAKGNGIRHNSFLCLQCLVPVSYTSNLSKCFLNDFHSRQVSSFGVERKSLWRGPHRSYGSLWYSLFPFLLLKLSNFDSLLSQCLVPLSWEIIIIIQLLKTLC